MKYLIGCCLLIILCPIFADINISNGTIEVNNGAYFSVSGNISITGNGVFVSHTNKSLSGVSSIEFPSTEGSLNAVTITPTDGSATGTTSVYQYNNSFNSHSGSSVKTWWAISPSTSQPFNITFKVRNSDLNSLVLNTLIIYEWTGGAWVKHNEASYSGSSSGAKYSSITFNGLLLTDSKSSHILILGDQSDPTLPVELSSFTAVLESGLFVKLNWTTQSESNMLGYHVYRGNNNNLGEAVRVTNNLLQATNTSNVYNYSYSDQSTQPNTQYSYWLQSAELNGITNFYGPLNVLTQDNAVEPPAIPLVTGIENIYPNPFNPQTTISYELSEPSKVRIQIFNVKGQFITELTRDNLPAGKFKVVWDGKDMNKRNLGSGVYFCKMMTNKESYLKKMIIMK